jgi:hypothetical protein
MSAPERNRTIKPFAGDLRQTILSAAASIGSDGKGQGGLLGYVESLAAHSDPKVAAQGRALLECLKANPISKEDHIRVD